MQTVDRFSLSSSSTSSVNESLRPSRSTRQSTSEAHSHSGNTPASSTMATQEQGDSSDQPNDVCAIDPDVDDNASICSEKSEKALDHPPLRPETSAVSHPLPTREQMEAAADITIYDADGNPRPFRQLFQGSEHEGQQQMIIFVRHFFCSLCQAYIKALVDTITPTRYFSIPISTTITFIGCGSPELIKKYTERTSCPFRMYVDPRRTLYKALGLNRSWVLGKKMEYNSDAQLKILKDSFGQMFKASAKEVARGGNMLQVGGEFLFRGGKCVWCHRMKTTRDHVEVRLLDKILEARDEDLQKPDFSPLKEPARPPKPVTPNKLKDSSKRK